jgi:hypothetical protein
MIARRRTPRGARTAARGPRGAGGPMTARAAHGEAAR